MESGASRCLGRTQKRLQAGQRVPLEIGLSFLFFLILLLAGCQCVPLQSKFTSDCGSRGHGTCRDPCTAHENARALFRRLDLAAVFQIYSRKWGSVQVANSTVQPAKARFRGFVPRLAAVGHWLN